MMGYIRSIRLCIYSCIAFVEYNSPTTSGQEVTTEQHLTLDLDIQRAEHAFLELREKHFWLRLLLNKVVPDFFSVPKVAFLSDKLVLAEDYEALSPKDLLALYQEKLQHLPVIEQLVDKLREECQEQSGHSTVLYLVLATMCLLTGVVIKFRSILSLAGAATCSIKRASLRVFCGASAPASWLKEYFEESPEDMVPLKELLENKEVPNHVVIKVIGKVVSHLQQLHSCGEISDIVSPPNVYVKVTEDKVHGVHLVPKYTNNPTPEVAAGHSTSPASDMYALGQLIGHCFNENKSNLVLPTSLLRLHQKAINKDPKRRPSASAARKFVADALRYWRNPRRGM